MEGSYDIFGWIISEKTLGIVLEMVEWQEALILVNMVREESGSLLWDYHWVLVGQMKYSS
jgi:hypothetical protein